MKKLETLSFESGTLTVKVDGYSAPEIGSGEIVFRDDDLNYEEDNYRLARIDKSEIIAIRDFLNRLFPVENIYDDPMFNRGVTHTVDLLSKTLGVGDWVAGDGSEDYDEDLATTLLNILEAKGLYESDDAIFAQTFNTNDREGD